MTGQDAKDNTYVARENRRKTPIYWKRKADLGIQRDEKVRIVLELEGVDFALSPLRFFRSLSGC